MTDKHLSTQFDSELSDISARVLEMGGRVEQQLVQALYALEHLAGDVASSILVEERTVNALELSIDHDLTSVIARRQPTARDLRLLIAISKAVGNLERVGDEAARIARVVHRLLNGAGGIHLRLSMHELPTAGQMAARQLRAALDSFARLDAAAARHVITSDRQLDREFDGLMRKLITYMMEDARTISAAIDLVFVAKAIERIGDHAKNLAEQVVYVVEGEDIRHQSPTSEIESMA